MPFKARYDKLEDVPEFLRPDFVQTNSGKWELKSDAIEGGAELLNPGLAANRDALRGEKETAVRNAQAAETRAQNAERELQAVKVQGGRVLGPDDAKLFDKLVSLGNPSEIAKIVKEFPELKQKLELISQTEEWRQAAKEGNLNFDVLSDVLKSERGKDLKLVTREVEIENPEKPGEKVKVKQPFFVKTEKQSDNTFKETEVPVLDFAKNNWPSYLVSSLSVTGEGEGTGTGGGAPAPSPAPAPAGPRLPSLGGGGTLPTKGGAIDNAAVVERFNQGRNVRPNPLAPATPAKNGGGKGGL